MEARLSVRGYKRRTEVKPSPEVRNLTRTITYNLIFNIIYYINNINIEYLIIFYLYKLTFNIFIFII